ncbi:MAG: hypothetical protein WC787_00705 [Patescibacteria group bacterium]|jgi:hypothetical protein
MSTRGWIIVVISAFVAAMLEASFLPFLPSPWREIRPVLQIAVIFVVLNSPRGALVYAGIAGLLLDIFRLDSGTFAFGRLIAVTLLMILLSDTVLTNRSVYATVALSLVARFADRIWLWIVHAIGTNIFRMDIRIEPLTSLFLSIAWDIGLISLVFVLLAVFTRRFMVTAPRSRRFYG